MIDPLQFELQQLNEYVRHNLQVYVTWFTFFLTLLLGAMAWSLKASMDRHGKVVTPFPFFCMVFLFTIQLVLAILATAAVRKSFLLTDQRIDVIVGVLNGKPSGAVDVCQPIGCENSFPDSLHTAMDLMQFTLVTNLVFWIVIAIYVARRKGQQLLGSAT